MSETDAKHRGTCIDRVRFDANGVFEPVEITPAGVEWRSLPPALP
jgi:hypothetical protein